MAEAGAISPPAVLTGIGLALPSGDSLDALWRQWLAQTPAWRPFQSDWIDSQTVCCFGAVAPELHARARENLPHRLRRYATRSSGLGVLAIGDALRQSGFDPGGVPDPVRFGLYTAQGDQTTPSLLSFQGAVAAQPRPGPLEGLDMARLTHDALYRRGMDPFLAIKALANNLLALASLTHRFRGEGGAFVQGESATCAALDAALFALRSGLCDVAVVAAAGTHGEAWNLAEMSRAGWLGHGAAQAASLRSFDRGRDGTVPAEGAAALVLETPVHARRRGARALACIRGAASRSCGLGRALPDSAYTQAARQALGRDRGRAAAVPDVGVDALLADGKGTCAHDADEVRLLRHLCAALAAGAVPMTTARAITGTIPAASGLVDVALAAWMLRTGCIPPVPGLNDPEDPTLDWVRGAPRQRPLRRILTLQHGFSGYCSAFVVEHPALYG